MSPEETAESLKARFGADITQIVRFRGEVSATVDRERIVEVTTACRDDFGFNYLSDVTATDWLDRSPRFEVVYNITSLPRGERFRLKVQVDDGESVPTVIPVWKSANWAEREVWDLFGINFRDHPNLTRFLLPEGWIGYPLRKDYAQTQIALPRPKVDKVQGRN